MAELFQPPALEQIARIIGGVFTGNEITGLFRKAGHPEIRHEGTKWEFLYSAFECLAKNGQHGIIQFIETACNPQEYFRCPERHKTTVDKLNTVLGFYYLKINEKGKIFAIPERQETIIGRDAEESFLLRNFHPQVVTHAKKQFAQQHYFDAVDECCKAFAKHVSEKSGLPERGTGLMSKALSRHGSLKLNPCNTETEQNLQEGLMHLCMGLMQGIRNPAEHEPQLDHKIDRQDSLDVLSLISYLYRQIDKCRVKQS